MLRRPLPALLLALAVLAGCGAGTPRGDGAATRAQQTALPALAAHPAAKDEILVSGQASPATHGPFTFTGRYLVRFEQYAPENPNLDFASQTPFAATLTLREGDPRGAIKLFERAGRSGRRALTLHGRYYVEISFGDYPYALRFTPRG